MGAKGGKVPAASQPQAARQLRLSQSSLGQAIPLIYGEQRVAGNLVEAQYFTAIPHAATGTPSGGKGGAMASGLVTRTYSVSAILALCEGALDPGDPDFADVPVAIIKQTLMIGRATPGRQVMTVSDKTGAKASEQPVVGWAPAVWKDKKVRRVVNDQNKGSGVGDPDGNLDSDDDDKDDKHEFRPSRWHDFAEEPDKNTQFAGPTRFISGPRDVMRGVYKNAQSANGKKFNHQRDAYIVLAGENYAGIACVARQDMRLGGNASLPNWNVPVRGLMQYRDIYGAGAGTIYDADPACILFDALSNPKHGAGWDRPHFAAMLQGYPEPWGALDATPPADSWSAYCRALAILISPVYDSQRAMADIVSDLAEVSNTAPVWSEATLKMIPYGDRAVMSADTGITFTPSTDPELTTDGANLGVRYALTLDDFLPGKNKDFVHVQRRAVVPDVRGDYKSDGLFNHVRVEFLNGRQNGTNPPNGYAVEIAEAKDAASIAAHGVLSREPYERHDITSAAVAQGMAERVLKRLVSVRNVYTFSLGWQFILVEPMDVLTFPGEVVDSSLLGTTIAVRVTQVEEDKDGALTIEAEDFPRDLAGVAVPPEPTNPTITSDNGGVCGGGLFSPAPIDGLYPPNAVLPVGAVPGTVYAALDAGAEQAGYSVYDVATPMLRETLFTALAVRPYFAQTFTVAQLEFSFRWRLFVVTPGGFGTSRSELEVVVPFRAVQWNGNAGVPSLRQSVVSSVLATGELLVPAGTLVCLELAVIDPLGNPITDSTGIAPGATNFVVMIAREAA